MSDPNSVANVNNVNNANSIAASNLILEPVSQENRPHLRIGGFQGSLPSGNILPPAPSSPSVANTVPAAGDVDATEESIEKRSEAELDAQKAEDAQEAEDAKIRAQRRKQLQELADSGELDFMNNVRPGKVYTLPVVKPKFL